MARFPEGRGGFEAFIHCALMVSAKLGYGLVMTCLMVGRAILRAAFSRR